MKKRQTIIVAGLGNPGMKYKGTRHNMGFMVMDELYKLWGLTKSSKRFSSDCVTLKKHDTKIVILKPLTYMNDSGQAIQKAMSFYRATPQDVIVVYDDIDLPVGALRIRKKGGPGTHNGMRSISQHIGDEFARIRIGIGNDKDLIKFVLSKPSPEDKIILNDTISNAAKAIDMVIEHGIDKSMQEYNKK
jgi:PTH1 family peptidyl-tRNA hydrolase